jgi:hypothetical protein
LCRIVARQGTFYSVFHSVDFMA